jgi:glycosyltransferase involved in cell wall biosynthesis
MDFLPRLERNDFYHLALACIGYIQEHAQEMDALFLRGLYPTTPPILDAYKQARPDGKVYLALDYNSTWPLDFRSEVNQIALRQANCVATSSRRMAAWITQQSGVQIEHIPNGFYNALETPIVADAKLKKNIILSVGRIGTPQKANEVLLMAFAAAVKYIPDWSLRFVGPVTLEFQKLVQDFTLSVPALEGKVVLTGNLEDKQALYAEYAQAKIFALTSDMEGGTPNVVAEALFHGCFTISSEIDAWDEVTDNDKCGRHFPRNDSVACATLLLEVCRETHWQRAVQNSIRYAQEHFDWNKLIQKLHRLLDL